MLELSPIIKSLWRSRIGPLLIVLQLALSIAIVSNALFFIQQRFEHISRPTGFAHSELTKLNSKQSDGDDSIESAIARDIAALEAVAGLQQAAPIGSVPFSNAGPRWSMSDKRMGAPDANVSQASIIETDHRGLNVLGLELVAGRNFHAEEVHYFPPTRPPSSGFIILTESMAASLFLDRAAVGETVYLFGEVPHLVVGVVKDFLGIAPNSENPYHNVLVSMRADSGSFYYLLRSRSEDRQTVLGKAILELRALDARRVINHEATVEEMMDIHYGSDRAMIIILSIVIVILIFINMLGIVGITTFWVNQRRRQIGIRRALGATRRAIVRYFLLENVILVVGATIVGGMIAFWASQYLVRHHAFELLPWPYIPLVGMSVLAVTVVSATVPAFRAARISPQEAVANR